MTHEGMSAQVSAEKLFEIDAALVRLEDALGYRNYGLAGLSGCFSRANALDEELSRLCEGIDWNNQCLCEAPDQFWPRYLLASSVMRWLIGVKMDAAALDAEYVIELENLARTAAEDNPDGAPYSRERSRRRELALYILSSADLARFTRSEHVTEDDKLDLGWVSGWWRAAERMLEDQQYAVDHCETLYEAILVYAWTGLDDTHVSAMRETWVNISEYSLNGLPVNTEDVRAALAEVYSGTYVAKDPNNCDCPFDACYVPLSPWMGIERKVGVRG